MCAPGLPACRLPVRLREPCGLLRFAITIQLRGEMNMAELFSADWMNQLKDAWNAEPEVRGKLAPRIGICAPHATTG